MSRGDDLLSKEKFNRLMSEQNYMYELHPEFKNYDPFYNSNLAQHAADFSYNMFKESKGKCVVTESDERPVICKKVVNAIDRVYVGDKCVIEGWAFYNEKPYNGDVKIWLKSDQKSCFITTQRTYRSDLAIHFKRKIGSDLSGFVCEFDKIDAGKYEIYVCCKNKATKTKKELIIC